MPAPCFTTTTPKRQHLYDLTDKGFVCKSKMPQLSQLEEIYAEIYNICSSARDGMSGALDFSVLISVAQSRGLKDFDDLMYYANEVETHLRNNREKK